VNSTSDQTMTRIGADSLPVRWDAVSLMYHDVIRERPDESGYLVPGSAQYKLTVERFREHLVAIAELTDHAPAVATGSTRPASTSATSGVAPFAMTFDDGGSSAYSIIAPMLEEYGWRGHFFVATEHLGTERFITARQAIELHERGHVIGSHSHSHPERFSSLDPASQVAEWATSTATLSDLLGVAVEVASVPNGYYSPTVARAAAQAGIRLLFTSEPTVRSHQVAGCTVAGRFSIQRSTTASVVVALVGANPFYRLRQGYAWGAKKAVKRVGGEFYLRARDSILRRTD